MNSCKEPAEPDSLETWEEEAPKHGWEEEISKVSAVGMVKLGIG